MQTLPRFVQQIFAKEKAILPLSPSCSAQEQQGQSWHALAEVGGIPQKATGNPKTQQNPQAPSSWGFVSYTATR